MTPLTEKQSLIIILSVEWAVNIIHQCRLVLFCSCNYSIVYKHTLLLYQCGKHCGEILSLLYEGQEETFVLPYCHLEINSTIKYTLSLNSWCSSESLSLWKEKWRRHETGTKLKKNISRFIFGGSIFCENNGSACNATVIQKFTLIVRISLYILRS